LSETARAVRIGARMADLRIMGGARNWLASRAYFEHDSAAIDEVERHSATIETMASELAAMLGSVPGGARGAALYRVIEREGSDKATLDPSVLDAARAASLEYHPRRVALGNWLEATRVAALRGDTAFLESAECSAEAEASVSLPGLPVAGRAALMHVRDIIVTNPNENLGELERAATYALRVLAK
jgi:hypothetical protein